MAKTLEANSEIAKKIIQNMDNSCVLKGDAALSFGYGVAGEPEDIEFDMEDISKENVSEAVMKAFDGQNIDVNLRMKKNAPSLKRYIVSYEGPDGSGQLRISVSKPSELVNKNDYTEINGAKVYTPGKLAEFKIRDLMNSGRPSDIFTIALILRSFKDGAQIKEQNMDDLLAFIQNSNMNSLKGKMQEEKERNGSLESVDVDEVINEIRTEIDKSRGFGGPEI